MTYMMSSHCEQKRQSTGNSTEFKHHQPPSPLLSIVPSLSLSSVESSVFLSDDAVSLTVIPTLLFTPLLHNLDPRSPTPKIIHRETRIRPPHQLFLLSPPCNLK